MMRLKEDAEDLERRMDGQVVGIRGRERRHQDVGKLDGMERGRGGEDQERK